MYFLYMIEPFLFENVGQILICIFFIVVHHLMFKKNAIWNKNKTMYEVTVGGRGGGKPFPYDLQSLMSFPRPNIVLLLFWLAQ